MLGVRIDIKLMRRCMMLMMITSRYRVALLSLHLRRSPVANYGTLSRSTSRAARKKAPPPQLHHQCPAASFPRSPTEACQEEEQIGRSQLTIFFRSQSIRSVTSTVVQFFLEKYLHLPIPSGKDANRPFAFRVRHLRPVCNSRKRLQAKITWIE